MTLTQRNAAKLSWLTAVGLLLITWIVRLHHLLLFPPFLDEADHISWARDVYTFHPFTGATNGKLFGLWWIAAFDLHGDGTLFVARAATVLFSLIAAAVVYSLVRHFTTPSVAFAALLAYSIAPFAFFFDRLILVDSYVMVWAAVAAWFAVRYVKRAARLDAIFCGLALVGAILAKATGVMVAVIPAFAILFLTPKWTWRKRWQRFIWSYGALAVISIPLYFFLLWRGYKYFSTATTVVGTGQVTGIVERIINNFQEAGQIDTIYFGLPFLIVTVGASIYLLIRRPRQGLFLSLMTIIPLAALFAFATRLSTRYFQFHVPFLILLVSVGIGVLANDIQRKFRLPRAVIPIGLVILWAVTSAIPFITDYWTNPLLVTLAQHDREEYVTADASGFALPEVSTFLKDQIHDKPLHVVGLLPNCHGLDLLISEHMPITVECPPIQINGKNQPMIAARVNELAAAAAGQFDLWIVLDTVVPYISLDGITAPLKNEAVFDRPTKLSYLTLYHAIQ